MRVYSRTVFWFSLFCLALYILAGTVVGTSPFTFIAEAVQLKKSEKISAALNLQKNSDKKTHSDDNVVKASGDQFDIKIENLSEVSKLPPSLLEYRKTHIADSSMVESLCEELEKSIKELRWKIEPCPKVNWNIGGFSVEGRPLIYTVLGDPQATNTTLVFSMVHGDEITPLFIGIELIEWLKKNPEAIAGTKVIIAPLVNPDSFFKKPKSRTNARGVDVNRNLPTSDWDTKALKAWKQQFKSNPRRYPGSASNSEPETMFQVELIKKFQPQKLLSVHAPLNVMDYDGPNTLTLARFPKEYINECIKLQKRLKAVHSGFFPGSLGNYAGQMLGIPTLTLELPSADPRKAEKFWLQFRTGISAMIQFTVPTLALGEK